MAETTTLESTPSTPGTQDAEPTTAAAATEANDGVLTFTVDQIGQTVQVPPTQLLLTRNVREAKPDKALIDSVRDLGVLQAIVAVLTDEGRLLVRFGERRTHASIEAGCATVPVHIASIDSLEKEAEIRRVIAQRDENTHRTGLTASEEIGVVETLTGLGLSPAQITKKARIRRAEVDAALVVSASELARKAAARYENLTIDQAAVVAEFADDPETVKALIVASTTGEFDHAAQRARDERVQAKHREDLLAALAAAGTTVVDRPGYDDKLTRRLDNLRRSASDKTPLEADNHGECPGHVAWISTEWVEVDRHGELLVLPERPTIEEPEPPYEWDAYEDYQAAIAEGEGPEDDPDLVDPRAGIDADVLAEYDAAYAEYEAAWSSYQEQRDKAKAGARRIQRPVAVYGCQGWSKHGHADRYGSTSSTKPKASELSEDEREKAKAERKLVIENNKAWAAAQPVRRDWLAKFAKSKTAPKGAAAFLASAFSRDSHCFTSVGGNHLAAELLGKKAGEYGYVDLSPAKSTTEARALVILLVQALAGHEASLTSGAWRENGTDNATGRYLRFLTSCGYPLSAVETYAAGPETA